MQAARCSDGSSRSLQADHQNKPDVGSAEAQRYIQEQGIRAITLGGSSAVGLAAQARAAEAKVFTLASGAYAPGFSEAQCSPYGFQFAPSTQELSRAVTSRIVGEGKKTWHMILPITCSIILLRDDASKSIDAAGGKVLGQTLHPLNSNDMASALSDGARFRRRRHRPRECRHRSRDHGEAGGAVRAWKQARRDDGLREQHRGALSRGFQRHAHVGLDLLGPERQDAHSARD